MVDTEVSFTSLCYIEDHHDDRVWLHRLADIENGKLHIPFKSDREDNRFENRDCWYQYQLLFARMDHMIHCTFPTQCQCSEAIPEDRGLISAVRKLPSDILVWLHFKPI